jgi:hypothetical protein
MTANFLVDIRRKLLSVLQTQNKTVPKLTIRDYSKVELCLQLACTQPSPRTLNHFKYLK